MMKKSIWTALLFCLVVASQAMARPTICLNMIVKNEHRVIRRCLESVKPMIDYWVIVDTGSTDNTQGIIREFMEDIPGELHETPWVNFAHNRNKAFELAKGKADYTLFIDADETLKFSLDFDLGDLGKDFYYITTEYAGMRYGRTQLVSNRLDWKWAGVLHEVLICSQATQGETLNGVINFVRSDGCRSQDKNKFQKDVQLLEAALQEEPNSTRYQFYLAQSYKDAREYEKAIENYEKRIAMGGWDQEVFWSMYQVGVLEELLEKDPDVVEQSYLRAYHYRPTRAEPLCKLARYHRSKGNHAAGYQVALQGLAVPVSDDVLFVEPSVYEYDLLLEYSLHAYYLEKYHESFLASQLILANPTLPQDLRKCVNRNLTFIYPKLALMNQQQAMR